MPSGPVRRRSADPRINLASNELAHPDLPRLHQTMLDGFDPDRLRTYPILDVPARAGAELLGREEDEITLVPGSDAGIRLLLATLADRFGGRLLVQAPNYDAWWTTPEAALWSVRQIAAPDADASLAAVTRAAEAAPPSLVAISWPNGPAGYTPALSTVGDLARLSAARGHLLVVDACYAGFTTDPRDVVALTGPACAVVLTWSKLFGLAGGRLAVVAAAPDIVATLRTRGQERQISAPILHALTRTGQVYDAFTAVWSDIAAERERLRARLAGWGLPTPPSGGNFVCIPFPTETAARGVESAVSAAGYRIRDLGTTLGFGWTLRVSVTRGEANDRFLPVLRAAILSSC